MEDPEQQQPQEDEQQQETLDDKIRYNQEQPAEGEEQTGEEGQQAEHEPEPEPQKVYAPPNPSIKECIKLNQILPVHQINQNIEAISSVIYEQDDILNEFLQKVDIRTEISREDPKGDFIKCEQNRDGDSYRSPLSNQYFPPPEEDAKYPSPKLRQLEEKMNKMFQMYTKAYYSSTAISSVYCWDIGETPQEGFGVAVLIKNSLSHEQNLNTGNWDSSNICTVSFQESNGQIKAKYELITTVSLTLAFDGKICGSVNLSGIVARSASSTKVVKSYYDDEIIEHVGQLVENLESNIRSTIENIYIMKSKEIVDTARYNPTLGKPGMEQAQALKQAWMGKGQ